MKNKFCILQINSQVFLLNAEFNRAHINVLILLIAVLVKKAIDIPIVCDKVANRAFILHIAAGRSLARVVIIRHGVLVQTEFLVLLDVFCRKSI